MGSGLDSVAGRDRPPSATQTPPIPGQGDSGLPGAKEGPSDRGWRSARGWERIRFEEKLVARRAIFGGGGHHPGKKADEAASEPSISVGDGPRDLPVPTIAGQSRSAEVTMRASEHAHIRLRHTIRYVTRMC